MNPLRTIAHSLALMCFLAPPRVGRVHAEGASLKPEAALPGAVLVASFRAPNARKLVEIRASFLGSRPVFQPQGQEYVALVPVPASAPAGKTPFYLKVRFESGSEYADLLYVTVLPRKFPEQHLKMPASKTGLMNSELLRKERELLYAAFEKCSPARQWTGAFALPISGRESSPWGRKRYVNGKWWGQHQGVDIAAGTGTPVASDAAGTVVLAQRLEMRGNTVVVDHGRGLFSAYNHLSRIDVAVGQSVKQGQGLGAVGATGFVTGAHLHWEARIGRTPVDPMLLVKQPLPVP
jgi:murein DD-endopeptidase MepM/ murein hydrolase activator NlpD